MNLPDSLADPERQGESDDDEDRAQCHQDEDRHRQEQRHQQVSGLLVDDGDADGVHDRSEQAAGVLEVPPVGSRQLRGDDHGLLLFDTGG